MIASPAFEKVTTAKLRKALASKLNRIIKGILYTELVKRRHSLKRKGQ
jgi:hypothetical protein